MSAAFDNPVFRRLYYAQVSSLLGTGLLTVALALLAAELAGPDAGRILGIVFAIKMVAYVVMAPLMSALLRGRSTRAVLVGSDAARIAMALALPWVGDTWQIFLIVFALQTASATFTPAFQSAIPEILPTDGEYAAAVSASRVAYDLEMILSPLLAAVLLTLMPFDVLFVGTAAGFALSASFVAGSGLQRRTRPARRAATTLAGLRISLHDKTFRPVLAGNAATAAATAVVLVNTVVYLRAASNAGPAMVGVALAVFGLGSITTALATPALLRHRRPHRLIGVGAGICAAGLAATATLAATSPTVPTLLAGWLVLGCGTSLINTVTPRIIRDHTDDTTRDDVFAAQFSLSHLAFLVTYPLAGIAGSTMPAAAPALLAVIAGLAACVAPGATGGHARSTRPRMSAALR